MAESESGLDVMRSRIKRASRRPPAPRGATAEQAPVPAAPDSDTASPSDDQPNRPSSTATTPRSARRRPATRRRTISPAEQSVNLAIRVRQPLDDHLVDLLHMLRRSGVRSSKVELIEMLLWELPDSPDEQLRGRLAAFRTAAPRGSGSSAEL